MAPLLPDLGPPALPEALRPSLEPAPDVLTRVQNEAKRRGLIIGRGGLLANVIRICASLIVRERDVDDATRILNEAFAAVGVG